MKHEGRSNYPRYRSLWTTLFGYNFLLPFQPTILHDSDYPWTRNHSAGKDFSAPKSQRCFRLIRYIARNNRGSLSPETSTMLSNNFVNDSITRYPVHAWWKTRLLVRYTRDDSN